MHYRPVERCTYQEFTLPKGALHCSAWIRAWDRLSGWLLEWVGRRGYDESRPSPALGSAEDVMEWKGVVRAPSYPTFVNANLAQVLSFHTSLCSVVSRGQRAIFYFSFKLQNKIISEYCFLKSSSECSWFSTLNVSTIRVPWSFQFSFFPALNCFEAPTCSFHPIPVPQALTPALALLNSIQLLLGDLQAALEVQLCSAFVSRSPAAALCRTGNPKVSSVKVLSILNAFSVPVGMPGLCCALGNEVALQQPCIGDLSGASLCYVVSVSCQLRMSCASVLSHSEEQPPLAAVCCPMGCGSVLCSLQWALQQLQKSCSLVSSNSWAASVLLLNSANQLQNCCSKMGKLLSFNVIGHVTTYPSYVFGLPGLSDLLTIWHADPLAI